MLSQIALLCLQTVAAYSFDQIGPFRPLKRLYNSQTVICRISRHEPVVAAESADENGGYQRRHRKNKYKQFSKVDQDRDPFDELLTESHEKLQQIQDGTNRSRHAQSINGRSASVTDIEVTSAPITFPDMQSIDPYDPTTFGYIKIGDIVGAHGVNGAVKVQAARTDLAARCLCAPCVTRHIRAPHKRAPRKISLVSGRQRTDQEYLVRLDGVHDRDAALLLRGHVLYARQEDEAEKNVDEYVVADLVNAAVFVDSTASGGASFVGKVHGVVLSEDLSGVRGLGHDMLEVSLQTGNVPSLRDKLVLIPMVRAIVTDIDVAQRKIRIDPPHGLLDLTYSRVEKVLIKGLLQPGSPSPETADA